MKKKDKNSPYRVIVIPDLQIPYQDKKALNAVEKYMADHTWDEWIQLGDFMDLDAISRFTKDAPRKVEGKRIVDDFKEANEVLDRHQDIVRKRNKDAKFTICIGNHEVRCETFCDRFPVLEGLVDFDNQLRTKERGINIVRSYPNGDAYKVGKALFTHGIYTGLYSARKHVDNFGGLNVFHGHDHGLSMFSKSQWGIDQSIIGQSMGCLCDMNMDYIGKNPKNWVHSFGIFYFFPNGQFTHYTPRIVNGEFYSPEGKLYQG